MRKTNKETELKAIELYNKGMSLKEVGKTINKNPVTVQNILIRNNVERREKSPSKVTECEFNKIKELYYINKVSAKDIAKQYGVHEKTIYNQLHKHGCEIRGMSDYHNPNLNHNYFKELDHQNKAYFLGFMIADGCVIHNTDRQDCIELCVHENDTYILNNFSKELCSNNKMYHDKNKHMAQFSIHSDQLAKDLSKYGVIPRKTFHTYLPKINDDMMPHLLRGLIDGDGWITHSGNKLHIGLCGTDKLMTQVRDYIVNKLNVYNVKVVHRKSNYGYGTAMPMIIWSSQKDVKKIIDYLYADAELYLKRKYEKTKLLAI